MDFKEDTDDELFKIVRRGEGCKKHAMALQKQPRVDPHKMILVSMADMEFKFSPQLYQQMITYDQEQDFGYPFPTPKAYQNVEKWVHRRYVA